MKTCFFILILVLTANILISGKANEILNLFWQNTNELPDIKDQSHLPYANMLCNLIIQLIGVTHAFCLFKFDTNYFGPLIAEVWFIISFPNVTNRSGSDGLYLSTFSRVNLFSCVRHNISLEAY